MGLTRFPHGVSSFGMPVIGSGELLTTGNIFFVDSGAVNASDGNSGSSPSEPWATIDGNLTEACTANNGDIIIGMPGHSEDPTSSIAMDVDGVWIYGMGWGASLPTVTFGALAATVAMSAANCRISNFRFDLGTVATTVTDAINITGSGCTVEKCETVPHATSQFTNHLTATDVPNIQLLSNNFISLPTAGSTSGIVVDGCDYLRLINNVVMGHFGEMALDNTTPAAADEILQALIVGNIFHNDSSTAGDLAVELDANATGIGWGNAVSGGLALASNVDWGNLRMLENYLTDAIDVTGVLTPTTPAA